MLFDVQGIKRNIEETQDMKSNAMPVSAKPDPLKRSVQIHACNAGNNGKQIQPKCERHLPRWCVGIDRGWYVLSQPKICDAGERSICRGIPRSIAKKLFHFKAAAATYATAPKVLRMFDNPVATAVECRFEMSLPRVTCRVWCGVRNCRILPSG